MVTKKAVVGGVIALAAGAMLSSNPAQAAKKKGKECGWAVYYHDGCVTLLVNSDGEWAGGAGPTKKQAAKDAQKYATDNGYNLDTATPVVGLCTSDTGADEG